MKIDRHLSWVLLRRGDEILRGLKKRGFGAGKLNGVGGKQEPNETIEECAIRETQEEIGVKITKFECLGRIIFDNLFYKNVPECNMMHCFVATEWEGEPTESDEEAPQWIKIIRSYGATTNTGYHQCWPAKRSRLISITIPTILLMNIGSMKCRISKLAP